MKTFTNTDTRHTVVIEKTGNGNSLPGYVLSLPYLLYKHFVSSQDISSCSFHPSCANYSRTAIAQKGLWGLVLGFDRLTRCHGLDNHTYFAHRNGTWLNPVGQ